MWRREVCRQGTESLYSLRSARVAGRETVTGPYTGSAVRTCQRYSHLHPAVYRLAKLRTQHQKTTGYRLVLILQCRVPIPTRWKIKPRSSLSLTDIPRQHWAYMRQTCGVTDHLVWALYSNIVLPTTYIKAQSLLSMLEVAPSSLASRAAPRVLVGLAASRPLPLLIYGSGPKICFRITTIHVDEFPYCQEKCS